MEQISKSEEFDSTKTIIEIKKNKIVVQKSETQTKGDEQKISLVNIFLVHP